MEGQTCLNCSRFTLDEFGCNHRGTWHENVSDCSLKCGFGLLVKKDLMKMHWSCCLQTYRLSGCVKERHVFSSPKADVVLVRGPNVLKGAFVRRGDIYVHEASGLGLSLAEEGVWRFYRGKDCLCENSVFAETGWTWKIDTKDLVPLVTKEGQKFEHWYCQRCHGLLDNDTKDSIGCFHKDRWHEVYADCSANCLVKISTADGGFGYAHWGCCGSSKRDIITCKRSAHERDDSEIPRYFPASLGGINFQDEANAPLRKGLQKTGDLYSLDVSEDQLCAWLIAVFGGVEYRILVFIMEPMLNFQLKVQVGMPFSSVFFSG